MEYKMPVVIVSYAITGTLLPLQNILPRPRDFSKALYTFDIGQNDLNYGFQYTNETQVLASIPGLIAKFSQAVSVSNICMLIKVEPSFLVACF